MTEPVKPRTQSSPLRREQAAITRARIVDAAAVVFSASGYHRARIEDIASEAGVAYPTVYKAFANKSTLLHAAVESAMTGGAQGSVDRQAWWLEQIDEPDPERQLRLVARNARRIYDRAGPLLEVVREAAAGDDTTSTRCGGGSTTIVSPAHASPPNASPARPSSPPRFPRPHERSGPSPARSSTFCKASTETTSPPTTTNAGSAISSPRRCSRSDPEARVAGLQVCDARAPEVRPFAGNPMGAADRRTLGESPGDRALR